MCKSTRAGVSKTQDTLAGESTVLLTSPHLTSPHQELTLDHETLMFKTLKELQLEPTSFYEAFGGSLRPSKNEVLGLWGGKHSSHSLAMEASHAQIAWCFSPWASGLLPGRAKPRSEGEEPTEPGQSDDLSNKSQHSRGHFPILSRDPSFQKTRTPGETAGF